MRAEAIGPYRGRVWLWLVTLCLVATACSSDDAIARSSAPVEVIGSEMDEFLVGTAWVVMEQDGESVSEASIIGRQRRMSLSFVRGAPLDLIVTDAFGTAHVRLTGEGDGRYGAATFIPRSLCRSTIDDSFLAPEFDVERDGEVLVLSNDDTSVRAVHFASVSQHPDVRTAPNRVDVEDLPLAEVLLAADAYRWDEDDVIRRSTRYRITQVDFVDVDTGDLDNPISVVTFTEIRQRDGSWVTSVAVTAARSSDDHLFPSCVEAARGLLVLDDDRLLVDSRSRTDLVSSGGGCAPAPPLSELPPLFDVAFWLEGNTYDLRLVTFDGHRIQLRLLHTSEHFLSGR